MPKPTREQIEEAGRRLQRGGPLGTGSDRYARQLVDQAGDDGEEVGCDILDAANGYKPRPWAR